MVWPIPFLINMFTALKGSQFIFYFNGYSDSRSAQENFNLITSFIQESADKHIPSKTSRSVSSVPWITPEIRRKIRRKNATHAKAKKTGSANWLKTKYADCRITFKL